MKTKRTIIAAHKAKDAALYCTHVVPVAICWEHNSRESLDVTALLNELLPQHIRSNKEIVHQLTDCIETAVAGTFQCEKSGRKFVVEELKSKARNLGRSLGKLTRGNETEYAFFEKNAPDKEGFEKEFVLTSLSGIDLIDTSRIPWEKIIGIRNDLEAVSKLRRLRLLFENDYSGKSRAYIEDDILKRLDDYNQVIEEYRFETKVMVLEQLIASKSLLALGSASLAAALTGSPVIAGASILAGASIEVGKACLGVAKRKHVLSKQVQGLSVGYLVDLQNEAGRQNQSKENVSGPFRQRS